jgi:hypothetical protein
MGGVSHADDSDDKVFYLFIHTFQVDNILNNLPAFPQRGEEKRITLNSKKL